LIDNVTDVPTAYAKEHVPGQLMCPSVLFNVPLPDTETVSVAVAPPVTVTELFAVPDALLYLVSPE
jgi:hypothetical protein